MATETHTFRGVTYEYTGEVEKRARERNGRPSFDTVYILRAPDGSRCATYYAPGDTSGYLCGVW